MIENKSDQPAPRSRIRRVLSSKFARNVMLVMSGTAGAQAIAFLFAPVLTRLYGPEAYGYLGTFSAVVAVTAPVAGLCYPLAISLADTEDEAKCAARLSSAVALLFAGMVALGLLIATPYVASVLDPIAVPGVYLLIPAAMFFTTQARILNQWVLRREKFGARASTAILHSLAKNGLKCILGLVGNASAIKLVVVEALSGLINCLLYLSHRTGISIFTPPALGKNERRVAFKFRDFALYRTPHTLVNSLSQTLPVFLLASFYGPTAVGFFSLARTCLAIPVALLGQSLSEVFLGRIVSRVKTGRGARNQLTSTTAVLGLMSAPIFIALAALGPTVFGFLFGEEWEPAGLYASWMCPWLFSVLLARPAITAAPALGAQRYLLFFEVGTLLLLTSVMALGHFLNYSQIQTVAAFSITHTVLYALLIVGVTRRAV